MKAWEYIRETARYRRKEFAQTRLRGKEKIKEKIPQWRKKLKRNEIFFKAASTILLSGVLTFLGYQLNARNVEINEMNMELNRQNVEINKANAELNKQNIKINETNKEINKQNAETNKQNSEINKQNAEINKRQLEITENEKKPYLVLSNDKISKKIQENTGEYKIVRNCYTITNEGGKISNVRIHKEAFIYISLSTEMEHEYYTFRCKTLNSDIEQVEKNKNKKFVFYQYISREIARETRGTCLMLKHYLSGYFRGRMTCRKKEFITIEYRDYMGVDQKNVFDLERKKEVDEQEELQKVDADFSKELTIGSIDNIQKTSEVIKENIENWLKKNGESDEILVYSDL